MASFDGGFTHFMPFHSFAHLDSFFLAEQANLFCSAFYFNPTSTCSIFARVCLTFKGFVIDIGAAATQNRSETLLGFSFAYHAYNLAGQGRIVCDW